MALSRRQFLTRSAAISAGATVGGLFAASGPAGAFPAGGYGPLLTDADGIVDLPAGFTYRVLANRTAVGPYPATQLGLRATNEAGGAVPGATDGMASFYDPTTQRTYLVINHETGVNGSGGVPKTFRGNPVPTYDPGSGASGGCTTLVLDASMNVIEHVPAISGNIRNCAGGPTPWGTWLTCEEDQTGPATANITKQHGYLFEIDPITGQTNAAAPYVAMGRANHEAVAIDPLTAAAYITEDAGGGLVYKFAPTDTSQQFGSLGNGGSLFAMRVDGFDSFDGITDTSIDYPVVWAPGPANPDISNLRNWWAATGAVSRAQKLEGIWYDAPIKKFWIVNSNGGSVHRGAIFLYDPATETIRLVKRINGASGEIVTIGGQNYVMRDPDNICATPYGGAIYAQDGGSSQFLTGVEASGALFPIARNPGSGEWAGPCFSWDGAWLFANMQGRALTIAITGPWTNEPPVVVPEAPLGVLLPLTGAAAIAGGVYALRNRRAGDAVL